MSWLNAYYLFHKNPLVMTSMEEKDKINVEMPCAQSCRVKKKQFTTASIHKDSFVEKLKDAKIVYLFLELESFPNYTG